MSKAPSFWRDEERALADAFVRDGYVIVPAESRGDLDRIRDLMADIAASFLKLPRPEDKGAFLDRIHEKVEVQRLNDLRLAVIREMNEEPWIRPSYFNTARRALEILVGNELAMQLRINLSIQLPQDDSSLLPVHADVWAGDSPYEVVLWIPYVNVYGTKTMYILPRDQDERYQARMGELKLKSAEELYRTIEPDLHWLDIPYGSVLLFTQNVMHGNIVNREPETRWLPLQERVFAIPRQEARRILRADRRAAGHQHRRQLQVAVGRLMQTNQKGYRGYVFSRSVDSHRVPQHIQNLVIRDYATRRKLHYLLSATEYAMPGCFLILQQVVDELAALDGVILYSMFMLPPDAAERHEIYRRALEAGCSLHAAVEGFVLADEADVERWENVLRTANICKDLNYQEIERWLT